MVDFVIFLSLLAFQLGGVGVGGPLGYAYVGNPVATYALIYWEAHCAFIAFILKRFLHLSVRYFKFSNMYFFFKAF